MRNASHITYTSAALLDAFLVELRVVLQNRLSWLTSAYGKADVLKRDKDGRTITYPGVPSTKGTEYIEVFPDEHLGNFLFFDVPGYDIDDQGRPYKEYSASGSIICWFDLRRVYPNDWQQRTTENVKSELIDALGATGLSTGKIRLTRSYDRQADIYRGYTDTEVQNQYMMRPYGAFRLDITMTFNPNRTC
jgi:hypothetical protein